LYLGIRTALGSRLPLKPETGRKGAASWSLPAAFQDLLHLGSGHRQLVDVLPQPGRLGWNCLNMNNREFSFRYDAVRGGGLAIRMVA
jgi:hypothetical protein